MQKKYQMIANNIIILTLTISPLSQAKDIGKIPNAFGSVWIKADTAQAEKKLCKSKQLTSDTDFVLEFDRRTNTYRYQGHGFYREGKIKSFSSNTSAVIAGKAIVRSAQEGEEETIKTKNFSFNIKNSRLFSPDILGQAGKTGLYHCQ